MGTHRQPRRRPSIKPQRRVGQYLSRLQPDQLASVVWNRLCGRQPQGLLPRIGRDEEPVDVFVDSARCGPASLVHRLQTACARLIEAQLKKEVIEDVAALGELVWLAGSVDATGAIDALYRLALRSDSGNLFVRGDESLRMRALRAASGLLAAHPTLATEAHRQGFERFLAEPSLQEICLTALVGLWRDDRDEFLKLLPQHCSQETLNTNLGLAGFRG